jgi:hypothetical protein
MVLTDILDAHLLVVSVHILECQVKRNLYARIVGTPLRFLMWKGKEPLILIATVVET